MRRPMQLGALALVVVLPLWAGASVPPSAKGARSGIALSGCGSTSSSDSLYLLDFLKQLTTDTAMAPIRADADVPLSSAISFWGSPAQCDSAAIRYRDRINAMNGDSSMPLRPMILVRVAPNRIVGYPKVMYGEGTMEFATFDSLLTLVKVWQTS